MTRSRELAKILTDGNLTGTLDVTGVFTGTSLDISGNIDVDGTTNLDVVDIDGAVDMATTLVVAGNVDFNGNLDVDGTTNLDVVDIDGAVDMASSLTVGGAFTSQGIDDNANAVAITITSAENVGIGTTTPASPSGFGSSSILHLKGASSNDCSIVLEGLYGSGGRQEIGVSAGDLYLNRGAATGSMSTSMIIKSSGNVGIGTTSPSAKLDVSGTIIASTTSSQGARIERNGSTGGANIDSVLNSGSIHFRCGTNEFMRIKSDGKVGIGSSTTRGKVTINVDHSTADGLYMDNASGGATMDLALLGSGYGAHGAAAGEIWLYTPDNINIGGATGNTNNIKFLANGGARIIISGSKPQIDYHGVKEYYYSGSLANSTIVVNIDIPGIGSAGVMLVQAAFNHYSINAYGAARTSNLGLYGGGMISTHDIQNISSGNGGSWSYSTPASGTIRITKNAGTYAGGGYYWVKVTTYI